MQATPTRKDVLARHLAKGRGHYQPGSCQANMELGLLRAACRWGLYQECWEGGDPTAGIKKWKRPNRKRTGKFEELRKLLAHFDDAQTEKEIRWRAIFGLMVFTGCRQNEARCAKVEAITPVPVTTYPLSAPPVTPPPVAVPSDDRRTMPLSGREREEWPW